MWFKTFYSKLVTPWGLVAHAAAVAVAAIIIQLMRPDLPVKNLWFSAAGLVVMAVGTLLVRRHH